MKGVQCYELFGGIALKNHTFSFFIFIMRESCLASSACRHHLQAISRKEKRKLVTDIVILRLFTCYGKCERFSANKMAK